MRSLNDTLLALKRSQPDYSFTELFYDGSESKPPSSKQKKLSDELPSTESQSKLICTEETLEEDDSADYSITLSKPKVPSPKKPQSQSKRKTLCLEDFEEIIAWIVKNKIFFTASFSGQLDAWVKNKIKTESTFIKSKNILELFVEEFHSVMQAVGTVDVRKLYTDTHLERDDCFPDVYACFIDAVNGITDEEGRNTEVLSNSGNNLLRVFLIENKLVAECLAYGLPKLDEIVELWMKENAVRLPSTLIRSPQKSVLSPPSSPMGKSPSKLVNPKNEKEDRKAVSPETTYLLANSMNSFLAHINTNGELRKPIPPPPAPIKVQCPPVPVPVEPGQGRKERVYLKGPMFPKIN